VDTADKPAPATQWREDLGLLLPLLHRDSADGRSANLFKFDRRTKTALKRAKAVPNPPYLLGSCPDGLRIFFNLISCMLNFASIKCQ
jgi:hypothetical protein